MKRASLLLPAALFAALLFMGIARAETADLTEANRLALEDNVDRLQQTELHRVARGRLKPNPVLFPYHTIYQTVMQDQEYILRNQAAAYRSSLMRLHKVLKEFPGAGAAGGRDVAALYKRELVSIYSIREELDNAETLLEVWNAFEESRMGMDMLPLRAGFAMNALRWLSVRYNGNIPAEVLVQFDNIAGDAPKPGNLFQADSYLRELSAEYSRLFLAVVSGNIPDSSAPSDPPEALEQ